MDVQQIIDEERMIVGEEESVIKDIKVINERETEDKQASVTENSIKDICSFFQQGKCRFGSKCFNLHEGQLLESKPTNTDYKLPTKKKKIVEDVKPIDKKPPMRTAGDVRKRIQWDPDLPSEHFTVGYIDRFDGVVEKQFDEFTWKHLATVDLDDLAIPQHRIQYYKYKGCKVWDKSLRLDHVFGSAGNNKTICEVMAEVEEELKGQDRFSDDDSEDDDLVVVRDGSAGGGISGSVRQEAIHQQFEDKLRATHFLCIKVNSKAVAEGVKEVQDHIIEEDPDLRSCTMPTEILHVTLSMIKCSTLESIERVCILLEEVKKEIEALEEYSKEDNFILVKGLSTFGARVLYSKLEVPFLFTFVTKLLQEKLRKEEDVIITNQFDYVPHMTLLKVNRIVARERRSKYINSSLYDQYLLKEFGNISFDNIQFCVINDCRGLDNFYLTHATIEF